MSLRCAHRSVSSCGRHPLVIRELNTNCLSRRARLYARRLGFYYSRSVIAVRYFLVGLYILSSPYDRFISPLLVLNTIFPGVSPWRMCCHFIYFAYEWNGATLAPVTSVMDQTRAFLCLYLTLQLHYYTSPLLSPS